MLVFIPIILLLAGAAGLSIIHQFRDGIKYIWITAICISIAVLVMLIALPMKFYSNVIIKTWLPFQQINSGLAFYFDKSSWVLSICLVGILATTLITDISRLDAVDHHSWLHYLVMTAIGILTFMAQDSISLVMCWLIFDVLDFFFQFQKRTNSHSTPSSFVNFFIRVVSGLCVLFGFVINNQRGNPLMVVTSSAAMLGWIIIGILLRVIVAPIWQVKRQNIEPDRGMKTLLGFLVPLTGLGLLSRIPITELPVQFNIVISICFLCWGLFTAFRWLASSNAINGFGYWISSLGVCALISWLNGNQTLILIWTVLMTVVGSTISLYSVNNLWFIGIPILYLLCMFGFPYTLSSGIWIISGHPFSWTNIATIIILGILAAGSLKILFNENIQKKLSRSVMLIHGIGLFIPSVALIIIQQRLNIATGFTDGTWLGIFPVVICIVVFILSKWKPGFLTSKIPSGKPEHTWVTQSKNFVSHNRISKVVSQILMFFERIITVISNILEGDGGLLWALLILAVLISLLQIQVGQ